MKKLPNIINNNKRQTTREYLQESIDDKKGLISKELSGYLCEREVYTPKNYNIIRKKYQSFIVENTDEISSACATHNKGAFLAFFDTAIRLTNDWTSARMLIHCCIQEFSLVGGMVSLFEWADDLMIHSLHSSSSTNR